MSETKQTLNGADRKFLRGLAHHIDPVAKVGKNGVTDAMIAAVGRALDDHELIKVKFVDFKDEKRALSAEIAERALSEQVGLIGNIAIYYRRQPDKRSHLHKIRSNPELGSM